MISRVLGNGCYSYFAYDDAERVTQILNCKPDGAPLAYFEYTYDAASRITTILREDGSVQYYAYDNADRLIGEDWFDSAMSSVYAFTWDYDGSGNRTYQQFNGQETYYTYNAGNELTDFVVDGSYAYFTYDSRGNCTKIQAPDGNTDFEYNHANLVTAIAYSSGVANYFYYDGSLRRYAFEDSDGLRYFTFDSNGVNLLVEQDAGGSMTAGYTHGYTPIQGIGSLVAAQKEVSGTTYYQYACYDHRGSVAKIVDENAEITDSYKYNAWGQRLETQEDAVGNKYTYHSNWLTLKDSGGELLLSPTRLYYSRVGRFLGKDSLLIAAMRKKLGIYEASIFFKTMLTNILRNLFRHILDNFEQTNLDSFVNIDLLDYFLKKRKINEIRLYQNKFYYNSIIKNDSGFTNLYSAFVENAPNLSDPMGQECTGNLSEDFDCIENENALKFIKNQIGYSPIIYLIDISGQKFDVLTQWIINSEKAYTDIVDRVDEFEDPKERAEALAFAKRFLEFVKPPRCHERKAIRGLETTKCTDDRLGWHFTNLVKLNENLQYFCESWCRGNASVHGDLEAERTRECTKGFFVPLKSTWDFFETGATFWLSGYCQCEDKMQIRNGATPPIPDYDFPEPTLK